MSVDPSLALQKALITAIKTAATAAGNNVFDRVQPADPFPRVTVGEGQSLADTEDCYDGTETFMDVNVWSRAVGFPQAKAIADGVRAALHDADLTLDDHTLSYLRFESSRFLRDPDGLTNRVAMSFRALTQPTD